MYRVFLFLVIAPMIVAAQEPPKKANARATPEVVAAEPFDGAPVEKLARASASRSKLSQGRLRLQ